LAAGRDADMIKGIAIVMLVAFLFGVILMTVIPKQMQPNFVWGYLVGVVIGIIALMISLAGTDSVEFEYDEEENDVPDIWD
jgi:cytosine/uracil/thiamine/allantoin permease